MKTANLLSILEAFAIAHTNQYSIASIDITDDMLVAGARRRVGRNWRHRADPHQDAWHAGPGRRRGVPGDGDPGRPVVCPPHLLPLQCAGLAVHL